jgi:monovalent cation:H+ antiporter-2, CPA2 family
VHGPLFGPGLSDALVILGAAGIIVPAFARLRVSPIIGFLLIGVLVGPHALGLLARDYPWLTHVSITDPEAVGPFAEFGIILLLFSVGLELSFSRLWNMRRLVFGVGAAELLGAAALITAGLLLAGQSLTGSIALGLALALSSTALVLPLVGTHGAVGRSALGMLLFEDLALVPIVFLLGAMAPSAPSDGALQAMLSTMLLGGVVAVALLLAGRVLLPRMFAQAARTKSPELFLSACLVVVIVAALATSAVGMSPILGALIAGIVIAETEYRGEVEVVTAPLRGLGLGIFLITIGMSVDLAMLVDQWTSIVGALAAVFAVKAAVTSLLLRLEGARLGVAAETGVLMASPSETTLIVLAAAASAQLIGPDAATFWQIVTAIGLTVTPLLAQLGRLAGRRVEQAQAEAAALPEDGGTPKVVILGFGRVGRLVAEMLDLHNVAYIAVDSDVDASSSARREGFPVVFGDVSHPDLIERLRAHQPRSFVLTMDNPVLVTRLARQLRQAFGDLPLVARARDTANAAQLYRAGVTDAVPETLESSLQLAEATLVDLGIAMGPVIASIHEKRSELRRSIMEQAELAEQPRLGRRSARKAHQALGPNANGPRT